MASGIAYRGGRSLGVGLVRVNILEIGYHILNKRIVHLRVQIPGYHTLHILFRLSVYSSHVMSIFFGGWVGQSPTTVTSLTCDSRDGGARPK